MATYTYKRTAISLKKIVMFRILFILVKEAEEKEKSFDLTMEMRKVKKNIIKEEEEEGVVYSHTRIPMSEQSIIHERG